MKSLVRRILLILFVAALAGAIVGVWLLTELGDTGRLVALAIVIGITIYGEFRSISGFIEKFPPLRFIDSIGRVH